MKAYLSDKQLDLIHNNNHVVVSSTTNPSPEECVVLPWDEVKHSDYVACGQIECADKDGSYGCGNLKYSLFEYYVAKNDLGEEIDERQIPRDEDGEFNFDGIIAIEYGVMPRYFKIA